MCILLCCTMTIFHCMFTKRDICLHFVCVCVLDSPLGCLHDTFRLYDKTEQISWSDRLGYDVGLRMYLKCSTIDMLSTLSAAFLKLSKTMHNSSKSNNGNYTANLNSLKIQYLIKGCKISEDRFEAHWMRTQTLCTTR